MKRRDSSGRRGYLREGTQSRRVGHEDKNCSTKTASARSRSSSKRATNALVILLIELSRRETAITADEVERFWPMMRRAAEYLTNYGPATPEDRWEKDGGYSPFTMAAEIAALLVAADHAGQAGVGSLGE